MSQDSSYETVSIETQNDFIGAVRDSGVAVEEADGEMRLATTEGEGRATRYFVDGEKVSKGDVVVLWDTHDEFFTPAEGDEDEPQERTREEALQFAADVAAEYDGMLTSEDGVVSLVTGDVKGYITGSHVKASPAPITTVAEYRDLVAEVLDIDPSDVPIAPDAMMDKFRAAGNLDQETRDRLSEQNKARWEAGEYDHLRKTESDGGDDEQDEE